MAGTRRWIKAIAGVAVIGLLLQLFIESPWSKPILTWGLMEFLPADSGAEVDAIVVLGRGSSGFLMETRTAIATQLWQSGRAPMIVASGRPEARAMMEHLQEEEGVPTTALLGEVCSETTEENALFTAALLQPTEAKRILLLTDSPHMLRSFLTFRSLGFDVIPYPTPFSKGGDTIFSGRVLSKEYRGLLGYAAVGRFLPRSFDNSWYLDSDRLQEALEGDCTVTLDEPS
ncbi:MAG: YdcF family protein [Elainellaceae cyanobacterium]